MTPFASLSRQFGIQPLIGEVIYTFLADPKHSHCSAQSEVLAGTGIAVGSPHPRVHACPAADRPLFGQHFESAKGVPRHRCGGEELPVTQREFVPAVTASQPETGLPVPLHLRGNLALPPGRIECPELVERMVRLTAAASGGEIPSALSSASADSRNPGKARLNVF